MKIRRERTHQSGLTNIDFRYKNEPNQVDHFNPSLKYADFGTMTRTQYKRNPSASTFKEQIANSAGWANSKYRTDLFKNARYETASSFYFGNNKKWTGPAVQISNTREAQLENERWNDKRFTGDSVAQTAIMSFKARGREITQNKGSKIGRKRTLDQASVSQRLFPTLNKKEEMERKGTLAETVDILRVKDARKGFRRKYADRNTVDKIFTRYDTGAKGTIDAQDIYKQGKTIGVHITLDEAQVLVQSAKGIENKDEATLSVEEYANFLFSQSEDINVDLKKLQPMGEDKVPLSKQSIRSLQQTEMSDWQEPPGIYDDDYTVLDQKKVPQNIIESIESKLIKMNRKLKRQFANQAAFDDELKQEVPPDKNGNITVDQLKDFVLSKCEKDIIDRNLTKRDVEGFLSAFNYNNYGATNVNDISKLIFTRDDQVQHMLTQKLRANPPPEALNQGINVLDIKEEDVHNHHIKKLLNTMEDKVFTGKVKLFQVFRKFDKDNDGYISYEDFDNCLKSIKMDVSKDDVGKMMKLIDKNNTGYLTFTEFGKVFSPTMSEQLVTVPQNDVYLPNLQPSKQVNNDNIKRHKDMVNTLNDMKKQFEPSHENPLKKATRFGAQPDFANTFVNFQHPSNAPGFMSEQTRFGGSSNNFLTRECKASRTETSFKASTLNDKVSFQQVDKMKKQDRYEARLMTKRLHVLNAENVVADTQAKFDSDAQSKIIIQAGKRAMAMEKQ